MNMQEQPSSEPVASVASNVVQFSSFAGKAPRVPEAPAIPKEERVRQLQEELQKQRKALATTQASLTPLLERLGTSEALEPMLGITLVGESNKISRAAKHIAEILDELDALCGEESRPEINKQEAPETSADIVQWPGSGTSSG